MKEVKRLYQSFEFKGTLEFPERKPQEQKATANGGIEIDTGIVKIRNDKNKKGQEYVQTSVNCWIRLEDGTREYLNISDYNTKTQERKCTYRKKGTKDNEQIDFKLATDPEKLETCEDFMKIKFEVNGLKHETLHVYTLINFLNENAEKLNGAKVVVRGNAKVSEYNEKLQLNFSPKTFRPMFENEVEDLKVDMNLVYLKGSVEEIPFENLANADVKKVPFRAFVPVTSSPNGVEQVQLIPTNDAISIDVGLIDFTNIEFKPIYEQMIGLLNSYSTVVNGNMESVELEDYKYYVARFVGRIKSNSSDNSLDESQLTVQERFYLQTNMKSMADILKDRGVKRTTSKLIMIDAIAYETDEAIISNDMLEKKEEAPKEVSASQAFAMPTQPKVETSSVNVDTNTGINIPKMPTFNLGLK